MYLSDYGFPYFFVSYLLFYDYNTSSSKCCFLLAYFVYSRIVLTCDIDLNTTDSWNSNVKLQKVWLILARFHILSLNIRVIAIFASNLNVCTFCLSNVIIIQQQTGNIAFYSISNRVEQISQIFCSSVNCSATNWCTTNTTCKHFAI